MPKNCLTCALAKDQGKTIACTFDFGQVLQGWPMAPLCKVKLTTTPQPMEKIPDEDCAAYQAREQPGDPVIENITIAPASDLPVFAIPPGTPIHFTVKPPNREEYRRHMNTSSYQNPPIWKPGTLLHYSGEMKTVRVEVPE